MPVTLRIPTMLRGSVGDHPTVAVEAATLTELIDTLRTSHPRLYAHLFDETGKRRPHIALFLNSQNAGAHIDGTTALQNGDTLEIIHAVSGG